MQHINSIFSSGLFSGAIETSEALVTGARGTARRLSYFVGNGLTDMAMKLAMTVPLSSILSRRPLLNPLPLTGEEANEKGNLQSLRGERSEGGVARQSNRYAFFLLPDLLGRLNKSFFHSRSAFLASRHEVEIMYVGRTSEFLMMTSERMSIPAGSYTLGKLLCSLYKRGDRWVDELDDSHLMCTVNGQHAKLFDTIAPGAEIRFSSTKSIFEA